jgi:hypothetical protein
MAVSKMKDDRRRTMADEAKHTHPNTVELALGNALECSIQRWVAWSGRRVRAAKAPWLEGPIGERYVGAEFYQAYAKENSLDTIVDDENAGLLPDFDVLAGEGFDPLQVRPEVRDFYERTARYDFTVRVGWSGPFKHPPRTLIYLVGRNVKQFDIPLSLRTTDLTMENELVRLKDATTGETTYVGWLRRSAATGEAMLAGLYTTCELPQARDRLFKGVYPLPGGSATTLFRPENRPDGSFALVSDGRRFGEEGYYRIHRTAADTLRVKRVPMEEVIHVFVDSEGAIRAHHTFAFAKIRFLALHYQTPQRVRG